jgi:hypothetical protein
MNEQELRVLVREAIARHAGAAAGSSVVVRPPRTDTPVVGRHASHALFVLPAGADTDGPCLIEPAVACNHCGYCKSYGH